MGAFALDDPPACVDAHAVRDGLTDALGARAFHAMNLAISITQVEADLILTIDVDWRDLSWPDSEVLVPAECGSDVVKLIVDSVVRGTSDWNIRTRTDEKRMAIAASGAAGPWRLGPEAHVALAHTWGKAAVRPALLARVGGGAIRGDAVVTVIDLEGVQQVDAWMGFQALQIGAALERVHGSHVTVGAQALAGVAIAYGVGYPADALAWLPALEGGPTLAVALTDRWQVKAELLASPFLVDLGAGQVFVEPVRMAPLRLAVGLAVWL